MERTKAQSKYGHPTRTCDIVMKGGITSGVVYPGTVCELAKTYNFKSIGGTSAGAIAAAATAAAELGRSKGLASYEELERLPQWIGEKSAGGKSNLFSLFQPQPETRALFNTLVAGIGQKKRSLAVLKVLLSAIKNFPLHTLLGVLPGVVMSFLGFQLLQGSSTALALFLLLAVLFAVFGGFVGIAVGIYQAVARVPKNFYGLCTGRSESRSKTDALAFWLASYLDELAGMKNSDKPLTFGDLWGTPNPNGLKNIDLRMMTTNLTHGRPYTLPFNERIFYFDPGEFRKLFPEKVVRWMEQHPRKTSKNPDEFAPLRPLPDPADFPVVVAARMSLSFPLLVSAIPLHAVDYTRVELDGDRELQPEVHPEQKPGPERCWFSDGGISSNFPVHYFDQSLPTRPTFAINLADLPPGTEPSSNDCENIWMPLTNRSGILPHWTRFDDEKESGFIRLVGFFRAILDTERNWHDNAQLKVPGYRDRIVHVRLAASEGGLNLNMGARIITSLSERGRCAGEMLASRFDPSPMNPNELSWDNHRWIRYRSAMALLEEHLEKLHNNYQSPQSGQQSYQQLVQRAVGAAPSYQWRDPQQQAFALQITQALMSLSRTWANQNDSFEDRAPKPSPELRTLPKV
ncbi:patatin-like phospholipase family protein [Candidatus Acetothermia bacterium]|nr:patatin-like phospholipase family protein [Candidatus Acetothermia bacterium]